VYCSHPYDVEVGAWDDAPKSFFSGGLLGGCRKPYKGGRMCSPPASRGWRIGENPNPVLFSSTCRLQVFEAPPSVFRNLSGVLGRDYGMICESTICNLRKITGIADRSLGYMAAGECWWSGNHAHLPYFQQSARDLTDFSRSCLWA